jgi:dephospho-CoA kinase
MVLGLTGKYCAGKDAVARILSGMGWSALDVDHVGHLVLEELSSRVVEAFGAGIVGRDGHIDRKALGRLVFADPARLAVLEGILHPAMVERVKAWIRENPRKVVVNAAVLGKMGLDTLCQAVLYVTAPACLRVKRAMARDRLPFGNALWRVLFQKGISLKSGSGSVDMYTVRNRGTLDALERFVHALMERIARGKAR